MWKTIVATSLSLFLMVTWLSTVIGGNPITQNDLRISSEVQQLRVLLPHRPLISNDDVIDGHQLRWHFQFHPRQQEIPDSIKLGKIVKRSAPDTLKTDMERQSRGESPTDDSQKYPDDNKFTAVENELNQLSDTVNTLGNQTSHVTGQTAGNYTKFWGVTKSVGGIEDYVSFQDSSLLPNNANETLAQFFGITNIYVGGQQRLINKKQSELTAADSIAPDCPVCPVVAAVECPTLPEHIILTVTACESFGSSLGTCSVASIAPSGTIFVLFSSGNGSGGRKRFSRYLKKKKNNSPSVATAVIGVVASTPNTKVKMTCPYIPTDVTVTTQNGPVLPYKPREEAGFIQLIVTGTLTSEKYTMACVWSSSP